MWPVPQLVSLCLHWNLSGSMHNDQVHLLCRWTYKSRVSQDWYINYGFILEYATGYSLGHGRWKQNSHLQWCLVMLSLYTQEMDYLMLWLTFTPGKLKPMCWINLMCIHNSSFLLQSPSVTYLSALTYTAIERFEGRKSPLSSLLSSHHSVNGHHSIGKPIIGFPCRVK